MTTEELVTCWHCKGTLLPLGKTLSNVYGQTMGHLCQHCAAELGYLPKPDPIGAPWTFEESEHGCRIFSHDSTRAVCRDSDDMTPLPNRQQAELIVSLVNGYSEMRKYRKPPGPSSLDEAILQVAERFTTVRMGLREWRQLLQPVVAAARAAPSLVPAPPVEGRPSWDEYFYMFAQVAATRATCTRARMGAVLVSPDNRILATGYNGSPAGEPHCIDVGCDVVDGHCQRTLHAEVNAIAYAANAGVSIKGARLYLYGVRPVCRECAKLLVSAGITEWNHRSPEQE